MPIGEILVYKAVITQKQLIEALTYQKNHTNEKLGDILVKLGYTTKDKIEKALQ